VCGWDYFGPRDIDRDSQRIKLGTVAWDGSAPAEEHWECGNPSLSHAKCTLISWRGRPAATVTCHGHSKDRATLSTKGVIVYMGPIMRNQF